MRALLSLAALMIVLFLVMKLSGTQLQALGPTANMPQGAAAGGASSPAQRSAEQVVRALEQGAAARAADAASR